jgi:YVTN family beta-propeller protein
MDERSRNRVGVLVLALVASCGGRALDVDGGTGTVRPPAGSGGRPTGTGGQGGSATGGQGGDFGGVGGPAGVGGPGGNVGSGGVLGSGGFGGRGGIGGGGRGGAVGSGGVGGISGRGGIGGVGGNGGIAGVGGVSGRGGFGGDIGMSGRGGTTGTGGTGGTGGLAGTFGRGGFGGEFGTGGRGAIAGTTIGTGGIAGFGGTFGTGGTIAGSGGTAGTAGRGGTGGTGGMSGSGGTVCLTCRSTLLPISGRDLVYNPTRKEIYVSVAGDADTYPNTIVVVDPVTSSVTSTIPIGSNPGALALSDDGSTLWVGIDGAHAIRKVTMTSSPPVVGPLIRLTNANRTAYYNATSIAVLRGAPLSVAVVLSLGPYSYANEVRVLDDGVQRPTTVTGTFTASSLTSGPPGYVFGNLNSPGYFFVYTITSSGITQSTNYNVFRNYTTNIVYSAGRVYSSSGDVIDVTNPASPTWVTYLGTNGPIAMRDPDNILMMTNRAVTFPFTPGADVRIISASTFLPTSSVQLKDSVAPVNGTVYRDLVYAGDDAVAFLRTDDNTYPNAAHLAIVHDTAFGTPTGGTGGTVGTGGTSGTGGTGGAGGTGGTPNPCPGCTFTSVQAYGQHFVFDATRNLLYMTAGSQSPVHPSTLVTVDTTAATVASVVPVGNDPEPLALSDDGSALWVGLAGERRVRRMTPGTTPVPGTAYTLPPLLTSGEMAIPMWLVVLPGSPGSIAVSVYGASYGSQGVFILDDGQLRANFIQPPEVPSSFLINGPPGFLLAIGGSDNLIMYRLSSVGATIESYLGLVNSSQAGFAYSAGFAYASQGEVVDLTNPDAPLPVGRFGFTNCVLTLRSASRAFMLCPNPAGLGGPVLHVLDTVNFVSVGTVTTPDSLMNQGFADMAYIGGDGLALLSYDSQLVIMHAPIVGSPP